MARSKYKWDEMSKSERCCKCIYARNVVIYYFRNSAHFAERVTIECFRLTESNQQTSATIIEREFCSSFPHLLIKSSYFANTADRAYCVSCNWVAACVRGDFYPLISVFNCVLMQGHIIEIMSIFTLCFTLCRSVKGPPPHGHK